MFNKLNNIDAAFQYVRTFTILIILCSCLVSGFVCYRSFQMMESLQGKIYVLANGKAIEALASNRKDNIPVEARDHVSTFHRYFFTLDPDDKVIKANITRALYLADGSARHLYNDLRENGYYAGIISGNISQKVYIDSVAVDISAYPYRFRCYAIQQIIRPASIINRSLVQRVFSVMWHAVTTILTDS